MKSFFYIGLLIVVTGCNRNITTTKNYQEKISSHKTIAILPFDMTLNLTKGQEKIINKEDKAILARSLSLSLQKRLYFSLLRYTKNHKLNVIIQNSDETLDKLSANNVRFGDLHNPDKEQLLKILGVDAVFDPDMVITQQGFAFSGIALLPLPPSGGIIAGIENRNLHIAFNVSVKDLSTDTAFWNYKNEEWYMASNKIKKNKKDASENFLAPLFLNIDDLFNAFIKKQPYIVKNSP